MPIRYITRSVWFIVLLSILFGWGLSQAAAPENVVTDVVQDKSDVVPMSDAAMEGMGCLVLTPPVMAAAYAFGPSEIMMLVTGAVIIPSSSTQLFISLGGILGSAACGMGAALTPAIMWAMEGDSADDKLLSEPRIAEGKLKTVAMVEPSQPIPVPNAPAELSEDVIQSNGCMAGMLTLGAITLASVPVEIVGLSAGGVTVPSSTATLFLGILGTVLPAGCGIGAAVSLPLVALSRGIGLDSIGQGIAAFFGWGAQSVPETTERKVYLEAAQPTSQPDSSPLVITGDEQYHTDIAMRSRG